MRLSTEQIQRLVAALRRLGARRVLLFGSAANDVAHARDIDIAVEGIPLRALLEADVMVHEILGVPSDLVSREENPRMFDLICPTATVLYEQPAPA